MLFEKRCLRCGKTFTTLWSFQRYCGSKKGKTGCSWLVQKEQIAKASRKWHAKNLEYHRNWRRRLPAEKKEQYNKVAYLNYYRNRDRLNRLNRERKLRIKQTFVTALGGKCNSCGYDRYIGALDFHHLVKGDKEHKEDWKNKGFDEKIANGKIVLLCANCHREVHNGVREIPNSELARRASDAK